MMRNWKAVLLKAIVWNCKDLRIPGISDVIVYLLFKNKITCCGSIHISSCRLLGKF